MTVRDIQSFNINSRGVHLDTAPSFSHEAIQLIKTQGFQYPEAPPSSLQKDVKTLETLTQKLQTARDHKVRDRILGILKTAFSAALIAAGVLSLVMLGGAAGALIGIGCFLAYAALSGAFAASLRKEFSGQNEPPLLYIDFLIGGLIYPLCQAFGRIPYLERLISHCQPKLAVDKEQLQQFLNDSFAFCKTHGKAVKTALEREKTNTAAALTAVKEHGSFPEIEDRFQKEIEALEKAGQELEQILTFYARFEGETPARYSPVEPVNCG